MTTVAARPSGVETRRAILDAALDLFSDRSFDGASTRAIAEEARVTQPLLNYHFAGKEELWRAAVDDLFNRFRTSMEQRLFGLRGVDDVTIAKLMVRQFVEFSAANPQLHRIIMQESKHESGRLDWLVRTHVQPLYETAVAMFERLAGRGLLAPVASAHLYYLLTGAAATVFVMAPECRRLTGVDPFTDDFVQTHADLVVDLLIRTTTRELP
jgi:TetR/AcrR family transcriptional regulator